MEAHVAELLKKVDPKQYQKELDAQKIVRIVFKNTIPGQRHSFLKNNQACYLEDGKTYDLPEHIVKQLEDNVMPSYTIQGDVNEGPTMKRDDRNRFFIKRIPVGETTDEEKRMAVIDALSKNPGKKTEGKERLLAKTKAEKKAEKEAQKAADENVKKLEKVL